MNEFLTYEEAVAIIRPDKKNSYHYCQTRANHLIQSGDFLKPEIYARGKDNKLVEVHSAGIRLVTAESVLRFATGQMNKKKRSIFAFYCDGSKKYFNSIHDAIDFFGIYYKKINDVINTSQTIEVPLIGDRIKIVQEDCADTSIKTEFISFKDVHK